MSHGSLYTRDRDVLRLWLRRAKTNPSANPVTEADPIPCNHMFERVLRGAYELCQTCGELRGPYVILDYRYGSNMSELGDHYIAEYN